MKKQILKMSFSAWLTLMPSYVVFAEGMNAASFLEIPVGAGPAAMGGAYSTQATNAYAPVWNPAGLARLSSYEVGAQHLSYLESINSEFVSFVMPLGKRQGLGFSVQYLGTGDIAETDPTGVQVGTFNNYYAAYTAAYGLKISDRASLGTSIKSIQAKLADVSASAFAVDGAFQYVVNPKLNVAATFQNFGTKLKFVEQEDSLPLTMKLGTSYQPFDKWLLTTDATFTKDSDVSFQLGSEIKPYKNLALRMGYRTATLEENNFLGGLSVGLGVEVWGHEFAYAWVPYGILGSTQYFSMLIRFGEKTKEPEMTVGQYKSQQNVRSAKRPTATNTGKKSAAKTVYPYEKMDEHDQMIFEMLDNSERKALRKGGIK